MSDPNTEDIDLYAHELGLIKSVLTEDGVECIETDGAVTDEGFEHESSAEAEGVPVDRGLDESLSCQKVIEDVLNKSVTDCGAPFEEVALHALLALCDRNYPEWMRVRAQLKSANIDPAL